MFTPLKRICLKRNIVIRYLFSAIPTRRLWLPWAWTCPGRRRTGFCWWRRTFVVKVGSVASFVAPVQHDHVAQVDLGFVALITLPIFPLAVIQTPLDVDPTPLLQILAADFRLVGLRCEASEEVWVRLEYC